MKLQRDRRLAATLFAALWTLFFLTSSGGFESGDAVTRYESARSILSGNRGVLPADLPLNSTVMGTEGRRFSTYGPLQSLLMIPPMFAVRAFGLNEKRTDDLFRLVFNLGVIPLISAGAFLILFFALRLLNFEPRNALYACLVLAVASPLWYYSRTGQEENILAFGFVLWLLGTARTTKGLRGGLLLSVAGICCCISARWSSVAPAFPLVLITTVNVWKRRQSNRPLEVTAAALLGLSVLVALLYFNEFRFGSFWETGYGLLYNGQGNNLTLFSWSQAPARALALLFSPYRGLVIYFPALIILVLLVFREDHEPFSSWELAGLLSLGGAFLLNLGYSFWTAGFSWGPRFLVGPLILLGPLWARVFRKKISPVLWALLGLSVAIQLASTMLDVSTEEIIRERAVGASLEVEDAWICSLSPLCLRPKLTVNAVRHTLQQEKKRSIFWWPFRLSLAFGLFPPWIAWFICFIFFLIIGTLLTSCFNNSRPLV